MKYFILCAGLILFGCGALRKNREPAKNGEYCHEDNGFLQANGQSVLECEWNSNRFTGSTTSQTWRIILTCPEHYSPTITKNNKKYYSTCRNSDGDFSVEGSNGWVFCGESERSKWFEVYDSRYKRYQYFDCLDDTPRGPFGEPWGEPEVDAQGRYTKFGGPFTICEYYKKAAVSSDRSSVKCP